MIRVILTLAILFAALSYAANRPEVKSWQETQSARLACNVSVVNADESQIIRNCKEQ